MEAQVSLRKTGAESGDCFSQTEGPTLPCLYDVDIFAGSLANWHTENVYLYYSNTWKDMYKDQYSPDIYSSIIILSLLEGNFKASIENLGKPTQSGHFLAVKAIYIDLCSFLNEVKLFKSALHTSGNTNNFQCINDFLLQTHTASNILNKHSASFKRIRNKVFAHNFRDGGDFIEPSIHFKDPLAPVSTEELICFVELALLIISIAKECFPLHSNAAYQYLFQSIYSTKENAKKSRDIITRRRVDSLRSEIYTIKEALKNKENYGNVSRHLRCKIKNVASHGSANANVLGNVF